MSPLIGDRISWPVDCAARAVRNCNCPTPGAKVDPGLNQGSETIQLVAPGSLLSPRYNQVDVGIRKKFVFRDKYSLMGQMQVFNLINTSTVLNESYALGSSITPFLPTSKGGLGGGQPSVIANPRMFQLGLQFKF